MKVEASADTRVANLIYSSDSFGVVTIRFIDSKQYFAYGTSHYRVTNLAFDRFFLLVWRAYVRACWALVRHAIS